MFKGLVRLGDNVDECIPTSINLSKSDIALLSAVGLCDLTASLVGLRMGS